MQVTESGRAVLGLARQVALLTAEVARELGDLITAGQHRQALRYALRTAVLGIAAAWFGMRWGLRAFAG